MLKKTYLEVLGGGKKNVQIVTTLMNWPYLLFLLLLQPGQNINVFQIRCEVATSRRIRMRPCELRIKDKKFWVRSFIIMVLWNSQKMTLNSWIRYLLNSVSQCIYSFFISLPSLPIPNINGYGSPPNIYWIIWITSKYGIHNFILYYVCSILFSFCFISV